MQYNTQKNAIEIAEYGRNVQDLLLRANDIQQPDERLAYVEKVLDVMYALNPQVRITEDYRSKLWTHAFHITNYTLEVQPPEGIVVDSQDDFFHKQPARVTYPVNLVKFRHYGKNISALIAKAIATEDTEKREALTTLIASFMKMAQINYNREGVSDEVIRRDLHDLSQGALSLDGAVAIEDIARGNRVELDEKGKTRRGKRGGKNKNKNVTPTNTAAPIAPSSTRSPAANTANRTEKTPKNKVAAPTKTPQVKTPQAKPQKPQTTPKPQPPKPIVREKPKTTTPPSADSTTPTKKRRRGGRGRGGKGKKTE